MNNQSDSQGTSKDLIHLSVKEAFSTIGLDSAVFYVPTNTI